ncbi:MAG: DUF5693 family protein [Synergistaceae bacterium]|nr:DUF5693 family protein [Synergistaceae bacterium]
MKIPARVFLSGVLSVVLLCSGIALRPRLSLEGENRDAAIVVSWRDVLPIARSAGLSENDALEFLKRKGLGGLMAGELTGDDLLSGLSPVSVVPSAARLSTARQGPDERAGRESGTLLFVPDGAPHAERLLELLKIRAGTEPFAMNGGVGVAFPAPMDALRRSGLVPDLEGLEAGTAAGLPLFFRVAPAQMWQLKPTLEVTNRILSFYPGIAAVTPSGEAAPGYPDMQPLASLLKERGVPVAQVEFSRQLGASQLDRLAFPALIPLHSVTNEELLARGIGRTALLERMARAAAERSVRLLVLRPAVSGSADSALETFGQEVEFLSGTLASRGIRMGWPKPLAEQPAAARGRGAVFAAALACSLIFLLSLTRYLKRLRGVIGGPFPEKPLVPAETVFFAAFSCAAALAAWRFPSFARFLGAVSAALAVTEASLKAMDDPRHPWKALFGGVLFAAAGGLAVAALFSDPLYMLRLRTFSGVKLTLMLPPLLVVLHDMRRRIHPESLSQMLSRPPLLGELLLGLVLLALLALVLFRSDNVQIIPGAEASVRGALERFLIARPRSREIFIGYPCLLLYAFTVKARLWPRFRELLRVGAVLGFASVVNSFCHYHTPLLFILLREFNGLWTGLLLGLLATACLRFLALPLWQKIRFVVE